jgi:hypothetical protein
MKEEFLSMSKKELHSLVDQLPSSEIPAAERYLQFLISATEAPGDPEMLARIGAARTNPQDGIPH